MEIQDVLDVAREGVMVILRIASPIMAMALIVGLTVSLFQALTQIQEITLSFVPKILTIFLSLLFFLPFMMATLVTFAEGLAGRIAGIG